MTLQFEGLCNKCGLCCTDGDLRCINLQVNYGLGQSGASLCRVYNARFVGMPILLVNKETGIIESMGSCTYGDEKAENREIMTKGIGKGCSLTMVET